MEAPPETTTATTSKLGKRKRAPAAPATPSSPAPSDPGLNSPNPPELVKLVQSQIADAHRAIHRLLSSRTDLSTRPQLSISRGLVFNQVSEGSEFFKTDLVGLNRLGFRYTPAGINPPTAASLCRTIESSPTSYRVSWEDRSPFVYVTKDGLNLLGTKGFRSARCNAPIREGKWYMEVKIIRGGGEQVSGGTKREGSHVRLGFGRREAALNGPVGLDGYSYGIRDKTGDKVTLSRPRPYGKSFGSGDVLGMYISLPPKREPNKKDPHDPAQFRRERIAIDLKGQEVFEMLEYPPSKEMTALMDYSGKSTSSASLPSSSNKKSAGKLPERAPPSSARKMAAPLRPLPTLPGSSIAFFINGECQGPAYRDLYDYLQLRVTDHSRKKEKKRGKEGVMQHRENPFDDGTLGYYPFISLFNDAWVQLNPGPDFDFPPPDDIDTLLHDEKPASRDVPMERTWRPMCERYGEFMREQWDLDAMEEEQVRLDQARIIAREAVEEEKRVQKAKRKAQAEQRKRLKQAAAEQALADGERFSAFAFSPLRKSSAYEPSLEDGRSPAPTFTSAGDHPGNHSSRTSEIGEMDVANDHEEPGPDVYGYEEQDRLPSVAPDPVILLSEPAPPETLSEVPTDAGESLEASGETFSGSDAVLQGTT